MSSLGHCIYKLLIGFWWNLEENKRFNCLIKLMHRKKCQLYLATHFIPSNMKILININ